MKICQNDWPNLSLQQFGKFLNVQSMQSPETEIMHKSAGIDLEKNRAIYFWWVLVIWNHCAVVATLTLARAKFSPEVLPVPESCRNSLKQV